MSSVTVNPNWLHSYPTPLLQGLAWLLGEGAQLYASGGVVRDWLRGRVANDLDLTVPAAAMGWAQRLAGHLQGSYVPLDEREDVARVVWNDFVIDFSGFREGSRSIGEDLAKRDFTINAMAIPLELRGQSLWLAETLLDPLAGAADLAAKCLRPTSPAIFASDPLRLMRAYRFMAQGDFVFSPGLAESIRSSAHLLPRVAVERINYELELILAADSAPTVMARMAGDGFWPLLFPELSGEAADKALATLAWLVGIQQEPGRYLPDSGGALRQYLQSDSARQWPRWASLCSGLGTGAFLALAARLRWSRLNGRRIGILLAHQAWPAAHRHLLASGELLALAALKLVKEAGAEFHPVSAAAA